LGFHRFSSGSSAASDPWIVREDGIGPAKIGKTLAQLSSSLHLSTADLLYTANRGGTISRDVNGKDATGPSTIPSTFHASDPIAWRQWHHWNIAHQP
jgi:hypothetical protein